MSKSCAIIPTVRNNQGELVDSKFFMDLLSNTSSRQEAVDLYLITKGPDFKRDYLPKLKVDDCNEPLLSSFMSLKNVDKVISEGKLLVNLNREIGSYKKGEARKALYPMTEKNYRELHQKSANFNRTSPYRDRFISDVIPVIDNESNRTYYSIEIKKKTPQKLYDVSRREANYNLNERLREILTRNGISVGALTELEERLGVNGVTDFEQAKVAAEGLIELIRIAKGERGEQALPEEFAHFVIRAMRENSLVSRLLNLLDKGNLVERVLGENYSKYVELYNGDKALLAEEAAGKLLAKHLLKAEPIPPSSYRSFLGRVIEAIKNFFKRLSGEEIRDAMVEADREFSRLAKDILKGRISKFDLNQNIDFEGKLYQVENKVERAKKLMAKILANEDKRLKVYEKRNPDSNFGDNQRLFLNQLEASIANNEQKETIILFLDHALKELKLVSDRLIEVSNTPSGDMNKTAGVLRDIRNYIFSYKGIVDSIREDLLTNEDYDPEVYGEDIKSMLDETSLLLGDLFIKYHNVGLPIFVDFLRPIMGEVIEIPFGKYKGKKWTVEQLVKTADRDITFWDRWLDSMADSLDPINRAFDSAFKRVKERARLEIIELQKELVAAGLELEQAGYKDQSWMFERDSKGNLSGRYITDRNYALFEEEKRKFFKSLREKYGDTPTGEDARNYRREREDWYRENMETVGKAKVPKASKYGNEDFMNLSPTQRKFYDKAMEIKARMDSYLPAKAVNFLEIVKIRKDLLERVKDSRDVKEGIKEVWEAVKDNWIQRSDDTDFGFAAAMEDFEGRKIESLPIYFTKLKKGESMNDISTDVVSTLLSYGAMAINYREMSKVINLMELGRDLLREREIIATQGDKPLVEHFKILGREVENVLTKEKGTSRVMARLDDFFKMQIYGRYINDEGSFRVGKAEVSKAKTVNQINFVTSLNTIALNFLQGLANVAQGGVMMNIEAVAGEFFGLKDVMIADKNYIKYLPSLLANIGKRAKDDKLSLWNEKFNVMQESNMELSRIDFDKKSRLIRLFGLKALFFIDGAGEHWMHTRTSLAVANAYKMKAPNGEIVSLFDAMEVVPVNPKNPSLGSRLELKKGYTKEDGSKFTEEDIGKFTRKVAAINQRMHGIYNKADMNALQATAIGRLAWMFRKWVKPALNRRFKSAQYNYDLETYTEGYYKTSGRFFLQLLKDIKVGQLHLVAHWNELSKPEKMNMRRMLTEVGHFLALLIISGIIDLKDDDDDEDSWLKDTATYLLKRLKTEVGVMTPGPQMILEGIRMTKSPVASANTAEGIVNTIQVLNIFSWFDEVESGRYKGMSKAERAFWSSPIIPFTNTVYRVTHPSEATRFYN